MDSHLCAAIDGSLVSPAALQHTVDGLAREQHTRLPLARAMDQQGLTGATGGVVELQSQLGPELLDEAGANTSKRGVQVKSALSAAAVGGDRSPPLRAEQAQVVGAGRLVLGRHGWRGAVPLLVGGVTEGMARLRSTSVPIVRGSSGG
jgi:nucleotide-binding universal stress UspA family protein